MFTWNRQAVSPTEIPANSIIKYTQSKKRKRKTGWSWTYILTEVSWTQFLICGKKSRWHGSSLCLKYHSFFIFNLFVIIFEVVLISSILVDSCFLIQPDNRCLKLWYLHHLPGGSDGKESAYNAGDPSLIQGSGRFLGEGSGYPFQYSCLENSMDGGAWQVTVHRVTKSQTRWAMNTFTFTLFTFFVMTDRLGLYPPSCNLFSVCSIYSLFSVCSIYSCFLFVPSILCSMFPFFFFLPSFGIFEYFLWYCLIYFIDLLVITFYGYFQWLL